MVTNSKSLFVASLKAFSVDCVCDIGSRDGDQSILFRDVLPDATVIAFEANPFNYSRMEADARLRGRRIELFPLAVSESKGSARFHITDVDYSNPQENRGTSSLLPSENVKAKETIEVQTCRLDEFINGHFPACSRIGLWIDVEGAEFSVLKGISDIREKVVVIHLETARKPFRDGQKPYTDVAALLQDLGFTAVGSNMKASDTWGDVVFLRTDLLREQRVTVMLCQAKGLASYWGRVDHTAVFLKERWPAAYRFLRNAYLRLGT